MLDRLTNLSTHHRMLFFNRPKKRSVEHLQLHQYLALLDGGMEAHEASGVEKVAALALARDVWQSLALGAWEEINPARIDAWRNKVHGQTLVHIPAGIEDCFLVVVFNESAAPLAYFLFDIGSQYTSATIFCPAFGLEQTATETDIRRVVPQLPTSSESFVVLELRGGTYMQVYADGQGFHLEHQLVTTGAHYRCTSVVGPEDAADTLVSYAFGSYEWARTKRWERMSL